jgi:hypothetical protein
LRANKVTEVRLTIGVDKVEAEVRCLLTSTDGNERIETLTFPLELTALAELRNFFAARSEQRPVVA